MESPRSFSVSASTLIKVLISADLFGELAKRNSQIGRFVMPYADDWATYVPEAAHKCYKVAKKLRQDDVHSCYSAGGIRWGRIGDLHASKRFIVDAVMSGLTGAERNFFQTSQLERFLATIYTGITSGTIRYVVACEDAQVIGHGLFSIDQRRRSAHIMDVYIGKQHQQQGYAARIAKFIECVCSMEGLASLTGTVAGSLVDSDEVLSQIRPHGWRPYLVEGLFALHQNSSTSMRERSDERKTVLFHRH